MGNLLDCNTFGYQNYQQDSHVESAASISNHIYDRSKHNKHMNTAHSGGQCK
jgi:hypothetical protein